MLFSRVFTTAVTVSALSPESVTVHFIDVGQGDSIFIDTSGMDVLVDGGIPSAGNIVIAYLGNLGISRIHLMVATHMDLDHIGGLITVLDSAMQVDKVLINNQTGTTATYNAFISRANNRSVEVAQRGDAYTLNEVANLTILNPVQPLEFNSQNENSIAMRLQIGEKSFLLMGDAEADTEESILESGFVVKSEVLKVGHHGSNSSTTDAFLNAVSPSFAIISAGENNQFGHPHKETLDKLFAHGITVYGTYKSGNIVALANSTTITFQNSPEAIPEFPQALIMPILMLPILLVVIFQQKSRRHSQKHWPKV